MFPKFTLNYMGWAGRLCVRPIWTYLCIIVLFNLYISKALALTYVWLDLGVVHHIIDRYFVWGFLSKGSLKDETYTCLVIFKLVSVCTSVRCASIYRIV